MFGFESLGILEGYININMRFYDPLVSLFRRWFL